LTVCESAQRTSVAAVARKMSLQLYSQGVRRGRQCRCSVQKNRQRMRRNV